MMLHTWCFGRGCICSQGPFIVEAVSVSLDALGKIETEFAMKYLNFKVKCGGKTMLEGPLVELPSPREPKRLLAGIQLRDAIHFSLFSPNFEEVRNGQLDWYVRNIRICFQGQPSEVRQ